MSVASPQQALEQIANGAPLRPWHYWLFGVSTGGTFINGYTTLMTGVAFPLLKAQEHPDPIVIGLLGAALVMGAVPGSAIGGAIADRYGRKLVYLIDMTILVVATLMLAFSWNSASAIAFQFLVGVGIGMDFPVSSAYVSEMMPSSARTRLLTATIAFQAVGEMVAAGVAWILLTELHSEIAWRYLVGSTALPALLMLLARLSVPESPHWLMEQGRNAQAATVIAEMAPRQRSLIESLGKQAGSQAEQNSAASHRDKGGYGTLFSPQFLRITILTAGAWFLMDIATYGVGLFTPVILASLVGAGNNSGSLNLIAQEFSTIRGTGIVDTSLLVGALLGIWFVPKYGAIRLQTAGFMGMVLGMGVLTFASALPASNPHHLGLIFLGFIIFNLTMNTGPNSTTFILPAQLYPTRLRGFGGGFAAACSKAGATIGIFFLPIIKQAYGTTVVLAIMVVVSLLGYLVTVIFSRSLPRLMTP